MGFLAHYFAKVLFLGEKSVSNWQFYSFGVINRYFWKFKQLLIFLFLPLFLVSSHK